MPMPFLIPPLVTHGLIEIVCDFESAVVEFVFLVVISSHNCFESGAGLLACWRKPRLPDPQTGWGEKEEGRSGEMASPCAYCMRTVHSAVQCSAGGERICSWAESKPKGISIIPRAAVPCRYVPWQRQSLAPLACAFLIGIYRTANGRHGNSRQGATIPPQRAFRINLGPRFRFSARVHTCY